MSLRPGTGKRRDKTALIVAESLDNVGDLVLLQQTVFGLRKFAGFEHFAVRQWATPSAAVQTFLQGQGIEIIPAKAFARLPAGFGWLIIGGGQAIRNNASTASLVSLGITAALFRLAGRQCAALGIGVSALAQPTRRWAWRAVFKFFPIVSVRDLKSLECMKQLAPWRDTLLTADLGFLPSPLLDGLASNRTAEHLLIAPCSDAREGRSIAPAAVASIAAALIAQTGIKKIVIVAHDAREGMDHAIAIGIYRALQGAGLADAEIHLASEASQIIALYGAASAVITNRLHSVIFALLASKPIAVINDANDKLISAADRFLVPLCDQNVAITAQQLTALHEEVAHCGGADRIAAVTQARDEAAHNFELIAAAAAQR